MYCDSHDCPVSPWSTARHHHATVARPGCVGCGNHHAQAGHIGGPRALVIFRGIRPTCVDCVCLRHSGETRRGNRAPAPGGPRVVCGSQTGQRTATVRGVRSGHARLRECRAGSNRARSSVLRTDAHGGARADVFRIRFPAIVYCRGVRA